MKEKGKHSGTRSEDKWWTSPNARHQWRVPVPRLLGHGEWWHERHKRGSTWKSEGGTWPNQKPSADTRTFCRTLRAERNRRLPVLDSPDQTVAEWVGGSAKNLGWRVCKKSGYKRIKTHGTYHGQAQTLCTTSQLQRVAMSAPRRQEFSRRPCCSTLTNACGMRISSKKLC